MMRPIERNRGWAALALACALALPAMHGHAAAEPPKNWWFYIHNDRPEDLRALLKRGADPNLRYKNGQPAIMRAVVDDAWGAFDALAADPRTDLNVENPAGETPLMYLAVAGQTERARTLIARGAKVNRLGWTPLHYAASRGKVDTAQLLLDNGAMPNAPSPEGRTPLMMAAYSGSQEMVQLLLNRGADPATRDTHGQNAADWAREGKRGALAEELTRIIDRTLVQREAQRTGKPVPAAVSRPAPVQTPTPTPAPRPAQAAQPRQDDSGQLQGVSGVRLGTYD